MPIDVNVILAALAVLVILGLAALNHSLGRDIRDRRASARAYDARYQQRDTEAQ